MAGGGKLGGRFLGPASILCESAPISAKNGKLPHFPELYVSATSHRSGFRMGDFDLDLITRELSRNGSTQTLAPQTFQILQLLALRSGQLVTREELANKLWPAGIFVDKEQGLKKAVKRLREALGDSAENPQYIETLPRQGFRFIAEVHYDPLLGIQGPTAPAISVPGSARKHKTHRSRYFLRL